MSTDEDDEEAVSTAGEGDAPNGEASRGHSTGRDDQTDGVMAALLRSVKRAHLDAYLSGTGVIIERDGCVVEIAPDPRLYQDLIPPPFREKQAGIEDT